MASTLGIDIGGDAVKAVLVGGSPRAPEVRWSKVARLPTPDAAPGAEAVPGNGALLVALARIRSEAPSGADTVVAAVRGRTAPLVFLRLPFTKRKLLDRTVPFELEEHLPTALEDHRLAYQVLEVAPGGSRVVTALAPDTEIASRIAALRDANLEPRVLDLDLAALYTCALRLPSDEPVRAVLDVGADQSLLVVLDGDRLAAGRVLPFGAGGATERIARVLDVPRAAADEAQLELAAAPGLAEGLPAGASTELRLAHQELGRCYEEILASAATTLRAWERSAGREVARLFLTGGGARVAGLAAFATSRLGVEAEIAPRPPGEGLGDAWPSGAVAYGLALRGLRHGGGSELDFRTGPFAYGRELRELVGRAAPFALPAAAILAALVLSVGVRWWDLSREAGRVRTAVASEFTKVFPREPLTQDPELQVRRHVQDLASRLEVLRGPASAVETIAVLSRAVPQDVPLAIDEVLLEGPRLTLRGRTPKYDDLEKARASLAEAGLFEEVRIEEQERTGSEVRFRLVARIARRDAGTTREDP